MEALRRRTRSESQLMVPKTAPGLSSEFVDTTPAAESDRLSVMRPASLCILGLLLAPACPLGAQTLVYNNGAPKFTSGFEDGLRVLADDFTLGVPIKLTAVRFWAIEGSQSAYNGSISWWIYSDNAGIPGSQIPGFTGSSAPLGTYLGMGSNALAPYRYVYTLELAAPSPLPAGHYWLVLHNGPLSDDSDTGFFWAVTAPNSSLISQQSTIVDGSFGSVSGWLTNGVQLAFELAGTESSDSSN